MATGDVLHLLIRDESGNAIIFNLVGGESVEWEVDIPLGVVPGKPTVNAASDITLTGFTANWDYLENTNGFYLDVAIDSGFTLMIIGYANKDVGNVNSLDVIGLSNDTPYYYRIRAYNDVGTGVNSDTITLSTLEAQPFVDIDGNPYTTVVIGTQEWIVENLKTTHYSDGTAILNISSGANDWFLGSKGDILKMYTNLWSGLDENMVIYAPVGGFQNTGYWSSSETNVGNFAWYYGFSDGVEQFAAKDGTWGIYNVRACRTFISATIYALRDIGPNGGLIFNIINNGDGTYTYYEAAVADQVINVIWSNVNVIIGLTAQGLLVGDGQANTLAIIGQVGHLDSAAKYCTDFTTDAWHTDVTGAYCWYENDITNKALYGAIYNHYAVTNVHGLAYFERAGVQELGWRVPTKADFITLSDFTGGDTIAGGKLKEVGITHWQTPNTGATDEYGFQAIPGGFRSGEDGVFYNGPDTVFTEFVTRTFIDLWSTTLGGLGAYVRWLIYNTNTFNDISAVLSEGNYVRCVRDISAVPSEYVTLTDGVTIIRKGVRDSCFVVDMALTPLGFAGIENIDWKNLIIW